MIKTLDNRWFVMFMALLTLYSLFSDDFRLIYAAKEQDDIFSSLSVFCIVIFTSEIIFSGCAKENYCMTFYFYLDLIATLTLFPDVGWIWAEASGESHSNADFE
jgi:hypothetical protein